MAVASNLATFAGLRLAAKMLAEAARQAIAETAERDRRRSGLAAEARSLMQNKAYVAEAREVAALMEQLRGSR